jgi:hypothetical protein
VRRRGHDRTDWRPSPVQRALLRVALAPPDELGAAWRLHRADIPLDALDSLDWGSRRLVPLVAWRLRDGAVDDPAVAPLQQDLATSMLVVRAKLRSFAQVLTVLDGAGIEALVLKGVGIAPLAYPDPGTRPVSDLDVLIRPDDMGAFEELVAKRGAYRSYEGLDPVILARYRHAVDASVDGHAVDVHWRLLVDRFDGRPDVALFERAREICVGAVRARTLAAEDHLVHAIAHGIRRNSLAPVRWIADVARLVERQSIDWSLVEHAAAERRVSGVVHRGLSFVHRRYGVPVPAPTLDSLRRASGRLRGRPDLWSRSPKRSRVGGAANVAIVHYVLATRGWATRERLVRYPEYVRFRGLVGDGDNRAAPSDAPRWHG